MSDEYDYQLKAEGVPGSDWVSVTKEEWIKAERAAGFRPPLWSGHPDYMTTCATGGFSNSQGISGRLVRAVPANDQVVGAKPIALISEGTLRLLLQDTGGTFRISAPKWPTETETIPLYLAVPPATNQMLGWQDISTAPKTGEEFIARTCPEWSSFSCSWDGEMFVHYDRDDGIIAYGPKQWMPMPGPDVAPESPSDLSAERLQDLENLLESVRACYFVGRPNCPNEFVQSTWEKVKAADDARAALAPAELVVGSVSKADLTKEIAKSIEDWTFLHRDAANNYARIAVSVIDRFITLPYEAKGGDQEKAIKTICAAVVLGDDEDGNPVHLSEDEAGKAIAAYRSFLTPLSHVVGAELKRLATEIAALKLHPTTSEEYDAGYIAARNDAFAIVQEAIDNDD